MRRGLILKTNAAGPVRPVNFLLKQDSQAIFNAWANVVLENIPRKQGSRPSAIAVIAQKVLGQFGMV